MTLINFSRYPPIHMQAKYLSLACVFSGIRRKAQRIVHVPFFDPLPVENEARRIQIEDSYHTYRTATSSCIGFIISLKITFCRSYIGEHLLHFTTAHTTHLLLPSAVTQKLLVVKKIKDLKT